VALLVSGVPVLAVGSEAFVGSLALVGSLAAVGEPEPSALPLASLSVVPSPVLAGPT
jgi:hypothetical protein